MNTIKCPHCKSEIEISEAILREHLETAKDEIRKELSEKKSIELEDLKKQLDEQKKKNEEFREQELELRKKQRELIEKEKEIELATARKIDAERKLIEEKISRDKDEEFKIKLKEQEEEKESLKRKIEELNRKASLTGSQQLQGEALELELEEKLKTSFIHDIIEPIGKGIRGGDILHHVRNSFGKTAGIILWETKRAAWSPSWLPKLREDTRKVGASMSILVTETLPKEVINFDYVEGVLVTTYAFALPLAILSRRTLMKIAAAKNAVANKDEKLEMLYQYLQSDSFRHRFEAYAEGIIEMRNDLATERNSMNRIWKKREMQITKAENNIVNLWGELQGIMGNALPDIKTLSLPEGDGKE